MQACSLERGGGGEGPLAAPPVLSSCWPPLSPWCPLAGLEHRPLIHTTVPPCLCATQGGSTQPCLVHPHNCAPMPVCHAGGLGAWARSPHRDPTSLLSLNKEGLASAPGFWALYLWGALLARALRASFQAPAQAALQRLRSAASSCGRSLAQRPEGRRWQPQPQPQGVKKEQGQVVQRAGGGQRGRLGWCLQPVLARWAAWWGATAALWCTLLAFEARVERVSRRTANLAFCAWTVALALPMVLLLVAAQVVGRRGLRAWLLTAASRSMLPTFLVANVVTGAINLAVDTLRVGGGAAGGIVAAYITAVCALPVGLAHWRERVR